ncbi:MAG TPA: hypothetical protein VNT31_03080 [Nocardioides sp.]|nr:hypothetical protein [Nocardioides sp.]
MSDKQQPRPGQATLAGVLIIGGSIVVVLSAWQRIASLHTIEVQEELQRMLAGQSGDMGMTVDGLATTIRVLCLVGAGAATAATILGFQVFQRSMSARIALTVLSPLLLVGGLATASFLAPMVLAGIALLWLQPTRDWYAGRPWVQAYEQRRAERLARMQPPRTPSPPSEAPASDASAPVPPAPVAAPPVPAPPVPAPPHAHVARHRPDAVRRPGGLTAVCVMTWVLSALVVVVMGLVSATAVAQGDAMLADLREQQPELFEGTEITEATLVASVLVFGGIFILWALAAIVLAGLAFAGQNWARITLAVSSVVAGLTTLALSLAAPPLVVLPLVFAVSTWLLLRPDVAQWYQQRRLSR